GRKSGNRNNRDRKSDGQGNRASPTSNRTLKNREVRRMTTQTGAAKTDLQRARSITRRTAITRIEMPRRTKRTIATRQPRQRKPRIKRHRNRQRLTRPQRNTAEIDGRGRKSGNRNN